MLTVRWALLHSLMQRYVALVVSLVATMIVSRILTPAELGMYFATAGLVMMAGPLSQLGIGAYLVQERELTTGRIATSLGILCISSWAIGLGLFLFRGAIASFFGDPRVAEILAVTAFCFVAAPLSTPAISLLQRELRFDILFIVGIAGSIGFHLTSVVLAFAGFSYMSFAWAALVEQMAIALVALFARPAAVLLRPRLSEWRRVMRVGGPLAVSSLFAEIGNAAPQVAAGRMLGFEAAGLLMRARTVADLVWRGLLQGVLPVFLPTMAKYSREGRSLRGPVVLTVTHLAALIWPFFALLALLALPTVRVLFGPQWNDSAALLMILCAVGIGTPVTAVLPEAIVATGRAALDLKLNTIFQIVRIGLIVGLAMIGLPAIAWGLVVAELFYAGLLLAFAGPVLGVYPRHLVMPALQNAGVTAGAVAGPALLVASGFVEAALLTLLASAPLAMAGWVLALFAFGHPFKSEVVKVILRLRRG